MNLNKNLLCLKWDDFDSFVVSGLSNLYQKDDMSDTTLFCDGRSFKAHKIVLSIWSSYFREIFATTTHPHPVIVLRETTSSDLELILRFIYQGQLFVPFEDTERFLKTAEYFQIAGLRDMRVHLSSSERNGNSGAGSKSNGTAAGPNVVYPFPTSNNGSGMLPPSQSFVTPQPPSYAVQNGNSTSSIDGIPVQILGSSSNPLIPSPAHVGHPSSINPTNTILTNSAGPSMFSTNVIKPIPSRQPSRLQQPAVLSSSNATLPTPSFNNNLSNSRQSHDLMYNAQPILIVHNQKQNEYHESPKGSLEPRSTEQVLVFERMGNGPGTSVTERKVSDTVGSGMNETIMHNYNNHMHQDQEEVLGLSYLHENNSSRTSSNHSHIIQEAAVAAGVGTEDTEIIEIDDSLPPTDSTNGKHTKMNTSIVLAPSTSTPVYAVKRAPSHSSHVATSTTTDVSKASNSNTKSSAKVTTSTSSSSKSFKSKNRRQRGISAQHTEIEFVNCPKCDKRVKKSSLKVHIKRTHLEAGTVLICPICGKQISSKGVYYKHMYAHRQKSSDIKPMTKLPYPKNLAHSLT